MSFSQVADLLNTTPTAQKMDFIKDVSLSIFDHFENDVSRHISEHLILSKRLYVNPFQPSDAFHIETCQSIFTLIHFSSFTSVYQ